MKKVKIEWEVSSPLTIYENAGVKFSWLRPGIEKERFLQVTNWHSCRETFASEICKFVSVANPSRWIYKNQLDLKKTRIAVIRKHGASSFKNNTREDIKWMKCSARILNIFEKSQGWTLTRVSICEDSTASKVHSNVFVFTGSVKWMRSPQLLSLYLLIIRLGRFFKEFLKFGQVTDLEKVAKVFSTSEYKDESDALWFRQTWKFWTTILDNHAILFFNKSIEENYRLYSGSSGIKHLIDGVTSNLELRNNWKKIVSNIPK